MNYKKRVFFLFGLSMNSIARGESGIGILSKLSQLSMDLSRPMKGAIACEIVSGDLRD
jgi:hypothetical protein